MTSSLVSRIIFILLFLSIIPLGLLLIAIVNAFFLWYYTFILPCLDLGCYNYVDRSAMNIQKLVT